MAKISAIVICSIALSLSACKKKEIQGPKGDPGTPGKGGNTTITNSNVFVINANQWTTTIDSSLWQVSYPTDLITKEVVTKGSVKVYIQTTSGWFDLPYVDTDLFTQFGFSEGVLKLTYTNIERARSLGPPTAYYRLVVYSESARPAPKLENNALENEQVESNHSNYSN